MASYPIELLHNLMYSMSLAQHMDLLCYHVNNMKNQSNDSLTKIEADVLILGIKLQTDSLLKFQTAYHRRASEMFHPHAFYQYVQSVIEIVNFCILEKQKKLFFK
jgi:hypothetical protein